MLTIFTNVERQCKMLQQAGAYLAAKTLGLPEIRSVYFDDSTAWSKQVSALLKASDIVIFLWQGPVYPCELANKALSFLKNEGKTAYAFMSTADSTANTISGFADGEVQQIRDYILCSGSSNYQNFLLRLANKTGRGIWACQPPQELVWQGIYHPAAPVALLATEDYLAALCPQNRPLVGLLFSRESWIWQDTAYIDALIRELDVRGFGALPVFGLWEDNQALNAAGISQAVERFFYHQGQVIVSAVINTFKVGLTLSRQNRPGFLTRLNVPVIQAYNLLRPECEWRQGFVGMNPVELSVNVVQPEFDGVIHGGVVSSKEADSQGISRYLPVPERVVALADKAKKWASLHYSGNAEKKIAIIFHNYPPTNASIGSAQGLDSPESVAALLRVMAAKGYHIGSLPANGRQLLEDLLTGVTNDRRFLTDEQIGQAVGKVSKGDYKIWFDSLDPSVREELTAEWGLPPGDVFFANDSLIVPGKLNGNILITLQPPRGFGEDPNKIIHSPTCPPPHHYLAFYAWIREVWQADAVIHVGTHGSLEWLPGKNAGLSHCCYPELVLQDLPNIYPYYVTIVGEGIQAKRRGAACLIGHLCPPMSHADTYEELAELEELLQEYAHYKDTQPASAALVGEQLASKIAALHLEEDLPRQAGQPLTDYILRVHAYLETLKHMQIRAGLHILGEAPQDEVLTEFILALTRVDNGAVPSLPQVIAKAAYGYDYYQLLEKSGELLPDGSRSYASVIGEIWATCKAVVVCLQDNGFSEQGIAAVFMLPEVQALELAGTVVEELKSVLTYICQELSVKLAATVHEITNTLRALNGEYVEPGPGGAPSNGRADILPTGRNFYGVDPNNLPTPTAWKLGQTLADQVITRYITEEGEYPESIGIVLWSDSNMRTNGQCIAELLCLMGVRPVWQKGSRRVIGLEVIELEELKRPRIDVMARVSGLFRDTLFSAIQLMEQATALVAGLDEPEDMNFVKKHIMADSAALAGQGMDEKTAWQQASCRIFGCPPGGYGAGVAALIEAKNWSSIHDIADVYVRWGAHAYGSRQQGEFLPRLFRQNLGRLAITIKNIDNHEVHLLNSDDFNAYCGGMNAAVRSIRGKAPRCYIGDSADQSHTQTKSLDEEFRRVLRGESLNPKFIEGMKKHGYKGAADLAALVGHCYGWDATSEVMRDWMYENLAEKFALDGKMQEWMTEVNPWALQRIAEKLLEAERRGMWEAKPETKKELENLYLSIEGELEDRADQ
ncbi:cobaltochelatase subunit CobN [Sporomusa sphaeroides]|jgi:cobaltochelatase CobN|uniref:cobaltochelatase subunit CobN n=1 Tax=Sporomusa sphaeroides TaxID=47679 RepID=UPI002B719928|nr:cobaltochelatase subunit CobN [Sporomusa sphaeroides]HML31745.1 cobaltochelatase subunit CobN [Sporomusa sphaeroides]